MANAALPGLLPTPPKCMMIPPLLPTPPCVVVLPKSPPKPSRADSDERWDAHKIKPGGSPSSSSSGGQRSLDGKTSSPGAASSCERWDSNKKKSAATSCSSACRTSPGSSNSNSNSRDDSDERWDAHKKPASSNKRCDSSKRPRNFASSSAERWDAHKKPCPPALQADGESSTASNDMEFDLPQPQRALYAGPGFIASPEPTMLPMPSFMIHVA